MATLETGLSMLSPSNAPRSVHRPSPGNNVGKGPSHSSGNNGGPKPSSAGAGEGSVSDNLGDGDGDGNDDDDDDSNEHDEDDAEQPAAFAPSYGAREQRNGHKAGLRKQRLTLSKRSVEEGDLRKPAHHQRGLEYDVGDNSSVSSVSSVSKSDNSDDNDDDDDAAYEGVDDVSDDNDDRDMEQEEEDWILESEYERELEKHAGSFRAADDWMVGLDDFENRPFYSASSLFEHNEALLPAENGHISPKNDGSGGGIAASEAVDTPAPRRVHFDMSEYSSDSEKTTDDEYPDFLQQDRLDPDIRRMIENDSEPAVRPRSPHEFFVASDFYDVPENIYHAESETSIDSSSEYETEGETTDEEDHPPPATITHPRSILRRESSASLTPECEAPSQGSHPLRRRGPLRGTFIADPHKPVAVMAPNGKQLIVIPPYASSRHDWLESVTNSMAPSADNSPRTSISVPNPVDDSETDAMISPSRRDSTPMLSSGANLMMSALQNHSGGQVMGPPEAFYPSGQGVAGGNFEDDDEDGDSDDMLNVNDFVDFGGDGSSDDEESSIAKELEESVVGLSSPVVSSSIPGSLTVTPNRVADPSQPNSAEQLLNHLDRGVVTAFRRNHSRYQTLIKLPQHREFMPANSPSRPASVFRRSKLSDQKTPSRKRQASTYLGGETVRRKLSDSRRFSTSALQ